MFKNHLFKIFFSLFLILSFSSFAFAQEQEEKYPAAKGSMLLSGTLSFSTQVSPSNGVTTIALSPSMLYFFMNNIGAGPDLLFGYAGATEMGISVSTTTFGGGVKLGYYLSSPESKFIPFVAAGFKYISASASAMGISASTSWFQIKGGPGINILLGKNGTFSLQAGYQMDMKEGQSVGTILIEGGFGVFLF